MTKSDKLPAFQFYPGDWKKDPGIQALDFHDRGVWFEMLLMMHESSERGVLLLNGKPMSEDALARSLGLDKQNLTTTLTKLLDYGVANRRESDGAIFNRRMVRDEEIRQIRRSAGLQGGNPLLLNQKPTTQDNQNPTPSSSSSTSSSTSILRESALAPESEKPEKRKPKWPPPGDEVLPYVYLTTEQREQLHANLSPKEIQYWLVEMSSAAEQKPEWWKKNYRNHLLVLKQWRKRHRENGFAWNESTGLYQKNPSWKAEPINNRPQPKVVNPNDTVPKAAPRTPEQRERDRELILKFFPKLKGKLDGDMTSNEALKGSGVPTPKTVTEIQT